MAASDSRCRQSSTTVYPSARGREGASPSESDAATCEATPDPFALGPVVAWRARQRIQRNAGNCRQGATRRHHVGGQGPDQPLGGRVGSCHAGRAGLHDMEHLKGGEGRPFNRQALDDFVRWVALRVRLEEGDPRPEAKQAYSTRRRRVIRRMGQRSSSSSTACAWRRVPSARASLSCS